MQTKHTDRFPSVTSDEITVYNRTLGRGAERPAIIPGTSGIATRIYKTGPRFGQQLAHKVR